MGTQEEKVRGPYWRVGGVGREGQGSIPLMGRAGSGERVVLGNNL